MTNRQTGIYKIKNLENEEFYIGSAVSMKKRQNNHFTALRYDKHANDYLQRAWNKYGEKSFKFEIIEECEEKDLISKEQYYIDILNPEYNICKIAYSTLGVIPSKETRLKMSKSHEGIRHTEVSKEKMRIAKEGFKHTEATKLYISNIQKKPILQFDKQGNFIKEWNSVSEALITFKNVSKVLIGKRKTCGGFIWKYKNN